MTLQECDHIINILGIKINQVESTQEVLLKNFVETFSPSSMESLKMTPNYFNSYNLLEKSKMFLSLRILDLNKMREEILKNQNIGILK